MKIRKAIESDMLGLQSLFKEVDDFHAKILPIRFVFRPRPRRKSDIKDWMDDRDKILLIAEQEGKPVALINARQEAKLEKEIAIR